MATDKDKAEIKEMIQSLYKLANIPPWDGEVNEDVARVFGIMLAETQKCSNAFVLVPTPPGGRASITWLVNSLGRGIFHAYKRKLSFACARAVIYTWGSALNMADQGIGMSRIPKWA